ncbi:MAG: family 10 glycosylhydrolase, partial [Candidatus Izemoplasmatales bacterium]|nr:family 10 glycosylhydrolase [Candidatus Izemoplasmatales bacterium]
MKILKKIFLLVMVFLTTLFMVKPISGYDSLITLQRNGSDVTHFWSSDKVMIPDTYTEKDTEFRGVWVATVYNLNMPVHTSETQYKAAFQSLIQEVLESNMNAILFQVRPMNDAFYDSDYAPWSRYLSGIEGTDPGWDVLGWMIDEAHAYGIEFHAWMN